MTTDAIARDLANEPDKTLFVLNGASVPSQCALLLHATPAMVGAWLAVTTLSLSAVLMLQAM